MCVFGGSDPITVCGGREFPQYHQASSTPDQTTIGYPTTERSSVALYLEVASDPAGCQ